MTNNRLKRGRTMPTIELIFLFLNQQVKILLRSWVVFCALIWFELYKHALLLYKKSYTDLVFNCSKTVKEKVNYATGKSS